MCAVAGGMDALVRTMKSVDISKRNTSYSSEIWSELSLALFGQDHNKNRHWLWVMWTRNRNGVRDLLSKQQEKTEMTEKERHVEICSQDNETENLHLSMIRNIEPGSDENTENNEAKDEQQNVSLQLKVVQVEEAVTYAEEISDKDEAEEEQHVSLQREAQLEHEKMGIKKLWRKLPVVSKKFTITVNRKKWLKIVPLHGSNKLRQPWTHVLYNSFRQKNPCCTLAFKSQHIKTHHSRKINSPYLNITAVCTFASCSAKYYFKRKREPVGNTPVKISVLQIGKITHKKRERKFRLASNTRRGRIARALHKGVSQFFYSKLENTPVPELISGNITRSLNKNVLKVISSEIRKSKRIHADVFMEMYLTQSIMKECDFQFHKMPGYIQHFQVDPFGVHMYTETGVSIVVQHLRKKTPLTLYLDATGNVASKVPGQTKRLLYYSLTLPGCGQNVPPLPACEMLTNEHSIPHSG